MEIWDKIKEGAKNAKERAGETLDKTSNKAKEYITDKKFAIEGGILGAKPKRALNFFTRKYELKREKELGQRLKQEPDKEKRKKRVEALEAELKKKRNQERALQEFERDYRRKLEEALKTEPDEKERERYREEIEEELIKNRENQRPKEEQMTLIDEEEHPAGFAQREILRRRVRYVTDSGAMISNSDYLERDKKREERLNELYAKKTREEKTLSEQEKKDIESEINLLKKEAEQENLRVAGALKTKNLEKIGDVIDDFTDPKTKEELALKGKYKPMVLQWAGNEEQLWKRQVKEMLNYKFERTTTELRNVKNWYEEAKFEKMARKISIEPEKPSDKKMRNERVRDEYSKKKEWVNLRVEEYTKSQKLILEILKRMDEAMQISLTNDLEVRNLSTFLKKNPEVGQDWCKIQEAVKYQKDIEKSFRLEIGEQLKIQILKNTIRQDLLDILYRNFIDMFRGVGGPIVNILKGGKSLVGGGGALFSAKEVGAFVWNFVSGGVEFFLKETLVSPTRLGIKLTVGGGGAIEKKIRKHRKNEKIKERLKKGGINI